jgi:hypothetical protein
LKISVITPTCDRPVAFALAEKFMARQTIKPHEWIVADGGERPIQCTMGQVHLHEARPPGAANFTRNLLRAIKRVSGDVVIIVEDDDYYSPTHIETSLAQLNGKALLAGDDAQRYYNVEHRCWRIFANRGASLCQTAMRRELLPRLDYVLHACLLSAQYGVDAMLWARTPSAEKSLRRSDTVVGIKGLPGRAGLGIGHRPVGSKWYADPGLSKLQSWIGPDAALYKPYRMKATRT